MDEKKENEKLSQFWIENQLNIKDICGKSRNRYVRNTRAMRIFFLN